MNHQRHFTEENEQWLPVPGYEGLYEVSNRGRIRNRYGKILVQANKVGTDYKRVHLCKNNKAKHHSVHRLVAMAFVPNETGGDVVNHLDHNKSNNNAENLEWCTQKENARYSADEGRYNFPYANLINGRGHNKRSVIATAEDGTEYVFESITQAVRFFGISDGRISACCKNKYGSKTAYGFRWRYA